jgi:HK97 family phage prohead protease
VETKTFNGCIVEHKTIERNGVSIGIVEGYIATWDIDRGDDQFQHGAFNDSLAEHRAKGRPIRLKDHHGRTVGGFPIETVREDDRGLYGVGEVNLDVQQGRELMSLVRQGVLSDFSIGYIVNLYSNEKGIRKILKAEVMEGSIVDEPMNPRANVTGYKSVVPYQDLPLADREKPWDSAAAVRRVREFTESTDAPSGSYKRAFLWFDQGNAENFGAYKLPIADVIDGRLTAIPRAVIAAAGVMSGARGGVDIPEAERAGVIRNIEKYYAKMDMESPFNKSDKQLFVMDEVKEMSPRELEDALRRGASFSKSAAKFLASKLKGIDNTEVPTDNVKELFQAIKEFKL